MLEPSLVCDNVLYSNLDFGSTLWLGFKMNWIETGLEPIFELVLESTPMSVRIKRNNGTLELWNSPKRFFSLSQLDKIISINKRQFLCPQLLFKKKKKNARYYYNIIILLHIIRFWTLLNVRFCWNTCRHTRDVSMSKRKGKVIMTVILLQQVLMLSL